MQVSVKAVGLEELQNKLLQIKKAGEDTEPLMAELANHLYNISDYSFENEQSPDGISWEPIQARRDGTTGKILRASGDMFETLVAESTKDEAIVGLNIVSEEGFEYPLTHQFGTNNAWGKGIEVVARPFMPIHKDGTLYEDTYNELDEIIEDYMEEVLK